MPHLRLEISDSAGGASESRSEIEGCWGSQVGRHGIRIAYAVVYRGAVEIPGG